MGSAGVDSTEVEVMINVRCANGTEMTVRADLNTAVGAFKEVVARRCDVPARQQMLIYKGSMMRDDQTLQSYGLQAEHIVHMVCSFPSSGSPSTTDAVRAGGRINGRATAVDATPGAAATGADFSFLSGNRNLGDAGVTELEQLQQQQLTQNPDLMREMRRMPAVRTLMNNPDLMRTIFMSNPQTRDLIDRNPELAHTFNDPAIMRQTLETARNPQLIRDMMRNTDRARRIDESTPYGRLTMRRRRMNQNVQFPFFNVMAGRGGNVTASNPFAALLGNQGRNTARTGSNVPNSVSGSTAAGTVPNSNPLPNPWAPPQANTSMRTRFLTGPLEANTSMRTRSRFLTGPLEANTSTRTRSRSRAHRMAAAGGLRGGHSFPDVGAFRIPVAARMNRMLHDPATSQMIRSSVLSNPQDINQQMMTSQQSQLPLLDQQQGARSAGQAGDAAGLEASMNMFGGLETGRLNVSNTPAVPPDELYTTQLSQLQEMGFSDTQANIRALQATSGNVHAALERLLNNLDQ